MADRRSRSATELIDLVLDDGSYTSWDEPPVRGPVSAEYAAALDAAQQRTGLDEAVVTVEGRMRGRRVAVVACEFG
ncbi:MAG: acetyl-CoA carboxyl transferase, partial [Nocardioidaceae bacterium]|nr:acetyl-CoA carboxyl transferase [Nocardioidaceae bacterium]